MSSIADFEFNQVPLSAGVIRVSQAIRRDFPSADVERQLQQLVDDARAVIPQDIDKEQQLARLITLFFQTWGFGGSSGIYRLSDAIWLDKVLAARQGTPVSLGTIFLHIAEALALPLLPVIFPTQLILRADCQENEMWLVNPLNGETLNEHQLDAWIKGNLGMIAQLEDDDLDGSDPIFVIRKMLDTLKAALMDEKQLELALQVSETILAFEPDDPYEIRDRGLIYAQLDCNHIALSDLNYFVEQCPEDPISKVIKVQIHSIEHTSVVLH